MELGRQEPLVPARQPALANNAVSADYPPASPDMIIAAIERFFDEVDPLPSPFPWDDPDYRLQVPTPEFAKLREGVTIYWTDSRGQTWGPHGRVG